MPCVCDRLRSVGLPVHAMVLKLTGLGREERPGSWEAERASRQMKKATAGIRGGDKREDPRAPSKMA